MWFCASTNPVFSPLHTPSNFLKERRLGAIFNKLTMPTPGMTARTPDALDGDGTHCAQSRHGMFL